MIQRLFSYGTLQKEQVQIELFGRLLFGSWDRLPGYKLTILEIVDKDVLATSSQQFHPLAIPSDNPLDYVEGIVLEITEKELLVADHYEVEDYQRIEVILQSGKKAWIYVATSKKVKQ